MYDCQCIERFDHFVVITGFEKYNLAENLWRVPMLCKTERGIVTEILNTGTH